MIRNAKIVASLVLIVHHATNSGSKHLLVNVILLDTKNHSQMIAYYVQFNVKIKVVK
jgi:hypothetical protein